MQEMTLNELKEVELKILTHIDYVCKKNDIPYFLDAGTLLGAVRHKGFIPWDDDIDILVPRQYYDMFTKKINAENSNYKMVNYNNDNNYFLLYGKVCDTSTVIIENTESVVHTDYGVFVDVFPLDTFPNNNIFRSIFIKRCKFLRTMWASVAFNHNVQNVRSKFFSIISKNQGPKEYCKKLNDYLNKNFSNNAKYCRNIVAALSLDKLGECKWFAKSIDAEFEGQNYPIPIGYNEYLTMLYNDYMQLPPKEEQITHHTFKAYFKGEKYVD